MKVERDFEALYAAETDPWDIGDAGAERYLRYRELVLRHAANRRRVLDVGSGMGAFLARFRADFAELTAVELSARAVESGRRRFPFIRFVPGSAADPPAEVEGEFDAVVLSDVVYYLDDEAKTRLLRWVARRLAPGGIALVAGWTPGGDYPDHDETRWLVERELAIVEEGRLPTGHSWFVARLRRRLVAATIDYETWHPPPDGTRIDWREDVLAPASRLLEVAGATDVRLTLLAEMGEYFWLRQNDADVAHAMEGQWREALASGHDVQLHLHPNWLPELGARRDGEGWSWDWSLAKADDYPGDLAALIGRCRVALEEALRPIDPAYRVTCFRAGGYRAQPFRRLAAALAANGISCDSSVYAGGVSGERGYDYSLAYSDHQPYFASTSDPQLKAPPAETAIVELPIFTFRPGERWFLDGQEGPRIAERLLDWGRRSRGGARTCGELRARRRRAALARRVVDRLVGNPIVPQRWLPKRLVRATTTYAPEKLVGDDYFVLIGHTKGPKDWEGIAASFRALAREGFEFVTLSAMAARARDELSRSVRQSAREEAAFQVRRESAAILGEERNEKQSRFLQETIPLDRTRLLDLGCGAGYWSERIARAYPWASVTGVDCGRAFVAKARARHSAGVAGFAAGEFEALPYRAGSFDCVYADNVLEHAFDVDRTLAEIHRVLAPGGVLVAAIPSDARNPRAICDDHTWKTAPHDVRARLAAAGFVDVEVGEVDCWRDLGERPYPPSLDLLMHVRAWKRGRPATRLERALEAMDWVYRRLDPERSSGPGTDAAAILAGGTAWCWGYAVALGRLLRREGYDVRWVTMVALDHERGHGDERADSHEVLEVDVGGRRVILDPMANACIPHSLDAVLADPALARPAASPDERHRARRYDLYAGEYWYRRVAKYLVRDDPDRPMRPWRRNHPSAAGGRGGVSTPVG